MTEADIQNVIEAALLAAGRPLSVVELRELFDEFDRPELAQIDAGVANGGQKGREQVGTARIGEQGYNGLRHGFIFHQKGFNLS